MLMQLCSIKVSAPPPATTITHHVLHLPAYQYSSPSLSAGIWDLESLRQYKYIFMDSVGLVSNGAVLH